MNKNITPRRPASDSRFELMLESQEFLVNPYPVLRELRMSAPIYWSDAIGAWLLTRHSDILASFKDPAHFSNEDRLAKTVSYLSEKDQKKFKPLVDHFTTKGLIFSDPPDHTRLRGLVNKAFSAGVVEQMRGHIQTLVDGFIDKRIRTGSMDVMEDLAVPLPATVISGIMGAPVEEAHLFKKWADDILSFQGVNRPTEESLLRGQDALISLRNYLFDMIEQRRRRPTEDLLGKLVAVEAAGDRLTEGELISTSVTLLVAGHETTTSLIGNGIYCLLAYPDQLECLRQDPELLKPAIEETLRFESPVARQPRLMKADIDFGGFPFRKGEMVFQMLNAANRDPELFSNPDTFDIRRKDNRHMAFGHGIHFCIGAMLARTEAEIAIRTVLQRMPSIRFAEKPAEWDRDKRNGRMLKNLPVIL